MRREFSGNIFRVVRTVSRFSVVLLADTPHNHNPQPPRVQTVLPHLLYLGRLRQPPPIQRIGTPSVRDRGVHLALLAATLLVGAHVPVPDVHVSIVMYVCMPVVEVARSTAAVGRCLKRSSVTLVSD